MGIVILTLENICKTTSLTRKKKVGSIVTLFFQPFDECSPLSPEASENLDTYLHFSAK